MLYDNEKRIVHDWITKYTREGNLDVVTGYFSVGALAFLADLLNKKIGKFRFILGDISTNDLLPEHTIDLLNDDLSINKALVLTSMARKVTDFISQKKVEVKTLEPNFCHAKVYLFESSTDEDHENYFIAGSSNLTEAGMGLRKTSNVELNTVGQGTSSDYHELREWFDKLWQRPQAQSFKTVNGEKINFKTFLINEIQKIFKEYSPSDIYYKILFELFGDRLLKETTDPRFNRQIGRLENSIIFNSLYDFQKKGALSLIRMLQEYNGAILADAVGLGKTWTALAVMKYFQLEGFEILLFCPKKLDQNWRKYLARHHSRFEEDQFIYTIRFHTDLQDDRMESHEDRLTIDDYFRSDKPKLIVIDESHHFRNDKSMRYQFLVERILCQEATIKVLMLSATPINNMLLDIRNQFKLITKGDAGGFHESIGIRNIDYAFANAQKAFNQWRSAEGRNIRDLINALQPAFFRITDSLIVARTRPMILDQMKELKFPVKAKPVNEFVTPRQIGNFESFDELFDHFPPHLSAYQPSFYIEQEEKQDLLEDQQLRDRFLVKMMYILMIKRLESSWYSFKVTIDRIREYHLNTLSQIQLYESKISDALLEGVDASPLLLQHGEEEFGEEITIGRKLQIRISDIEKAGKLQWFKHDLKEDIEKLDCLSANLERFNKMIQNEIDTPCNYASCDSKLKILIKKINEKRSSGANNGNQKVLIFAAYKDTVRYLFEQLKARGFSHIAFVSGDESRTDDSGHSIKIFEHILERFAPLTKLFLEKRWNDFQLDGKVSLIENFNKWRLWISKARPQIQSLLEKPIDILIATDCLSEGQNLQDCDYIVNYDIHWNPVRLIQRLGRIDRLGSPNSVVFGVNFWPTDRINQYLDLQNRIEDRMTAMKLAGSDVDSRFTDKLREKAHDDAFERKQTARMLEQMQITWDDIEANENTFGFDDLSLEAYRQDLTMEITQSRAKYEEMPRGVYSGFAGTGSKGSAPGIIALLGYPSKPPGRKSFLYANYDLIYIDESSKAIVLNQREILDILHRHKEQERFVPEAVDSGDPEKLKQLACALEGWLKNQIITEEYTPGGDLSVSMGKAAVDILQKLKSGDPEALKNIRSGQTVEQQYKSDNCDLIAWLIIS